MSFKTGVTPGVAAAVKAAVTVCGVANTVEEAARALAASSYAQAPAQPQQEVIAMKGIGDQGREALELTMSNHLTQYQAIRYPQHQSDYFLGHYRNYLDGLGRQSVKFDLTAPKIGYFTQMPPAARAQYLYEIDDLSRDAALIASAKNLSVAVLELNGGLGSSMGLDPTANHSKATGIEFPVQLASGGKATMSILEAKFRTLVNAAGAFSSMRVMALNSTITSAGFRAFLDAPTVESRAGATGQRVTNREYFAAHGLAIDDEIVQLGFPKVDEKTLLPISTGTPETELAPGGHGQILYELYFSGRLQQLSDAGTDVLVIVNADGKQARPDPAVAAKMASEGIPAALISTDRTALDTKGGFFVVIDGRIEIVERNQVDASQLGLFESVGLGPDDAAQPFNTNTVYLNIPLTMQLLEEIRTIRGDAALRSFLLPATIASEKKQRVGELEVPVRILEGAIGSTILRFPGVRIFNASVHSRWTQFTPVKTPADVIYLFQSDVFQVEPTSGELLPQVEDPVPPAIVLKGWDGWKALPTTVDAFGRASMRSLRSLAIDGEVMLRDAILSGDVRIRNASGRAFDFNDPAVAAGFARQEGRVVLSNVTVDISAEGDIRIERR